MTFHSPAPKSKPSAPTEREERDMAAQEIAAQDMAAYVAAMCGELRLLSRRQGFDTLAYILELAKLEADNLRQAKVIAKGQPGD